MPPTDPLAELKEQHALHRKHHARFCIPNLCEMTRWLSLCDRLAAETAREIKKWKQIADHSQDTLADTEADLRTELFSALVRLATADRSAESWQEEARLQTVNRDHAQEKLAAAEEKAQRYLEQAHLMTQPCRCDPLWSGEELCNGGCDLAARLAAAEQERDRAREQHAMVKAGAAETRARLDIAEGKLEKISLVMAGRGGDVWP